MMNLLKMVFNNVQFFVLFIVSDSRILYRVDLWHVYLPAAIAVFSV